MQCPSFECVACNQPTERPNSTYIQQEPEAVVSEYAIGGFEINDVREYDVSEYVLGQAGNRENNTAPVAIRDSTSETIQAPSTSSTRHHHRSSSHSRHSSTSSEAEGTQHHRPSIMEGIGLVFPDVAPMLRCYSMEKHPKLSCSAIKDAIYGGKISLPLSFAKYLPYVLSWFNVQVMQYRFTPLQRPSFEKVSYLQSCLHCGVLDYEAPEEQCYLPPWMMRQLKLYDGYPVWLQYIRGNMPIATFARFKPLLSKRVLSNISDENIKGIRQMLEVQLRKYQCLTVGDEIAIEYNKDEIRFRVITLEPNSVVNITSCDLKVDFDVYHLLTETAIFDEHKEEPEVDENYKPGQLTFMRRKGYMAHKLVKEMEKLNNTNKPKSEDDVKKKSGFSGQGYALGGKPK
ncbi:hypothetical protein ACQ4LE_002424 [Meloidogyne hapla]|uniref:Tudor domain-containing protein n=1 Tax=Meloidogyne hapla TaxID=6305 RepID=A0A1I8BQA5_MELHA